jgi:hypothetical protein
MHEREGAGSRASSVLPAPPPSLRRPGTRTEAPEGEGLPGPLIDRGLRLAMGGADRSTTHRSEHGVGAAKPHAQKRVLLSPWVVAHCTCPREYPRFAVRPGLQQEDSVACRMTLRHCRRSRNRVRRSLTCAKKSDVCRRDIARNGPTKKGEGFPRRCDRRRARRAA